MRKNYSLQIAISSLFLLITVTMAGILSWQSFSKTSDIMLDSAYDLYDGIAKEFTLDFEKTYGSLAVELQLIALSHITTSKTLADRLSYLEEFQAVLDSDEAIDTLGIAFENGDYFGASLVEANLNKDGNGTKNKAIPKDAVLFVNYTKTSNEEPGFEAGKTYHIYFDKQLKEISRVIGDMSGFDPRKRLWYQQAGESSKASAPYVFYGSKEVGLTATLRTKVQGVVIAIDITLDSLNEKILGHQVTPDSEVILINANGQTFAYKDQAKVVISSQTTEQEELQLADLGQLGSDVLSHLSKNFKSKKLKAEEQRLDFNYNNRQWIGSVRLVAKPGGVDLFVIMLSPVDELLADAIAIRWQLIFTALIILLIFVPIIWFSAKKISTPLHELSEEAVAISKFEFGETNSRLSFIKEVCELDGAMGMMKSTINKFINLINSLAEEQNLDVLIKSITSETMSISKSDAALIYLLDENEDVFKADFLCEKDSEHKIVGLLPTLSLDEINEFLNSESESRDSHVFKIEKDSNHRLSPLLTKLDVEDLTGILLPLENRNKELIGLLCLLYKDSEAEIQSSNIEFVEALSGFAAVTLESRQLISMQEALLNAFIKLIAGAIDAKSPYTGGHCARVPEITLMLAKAACDSNSEKFKDFNLDEKQWEELSIAGWLHDCGKVTTPEYVVDKATKLETIYDRIHEVRARFEIIKRDAEIDCWQQISEGGDKEKLLDDLAQKCSAIDDDFAFVAECNVGGEFMANEKIERLQAIAETTWKRTLDDSLGLSWEELNRKQDKEQKLPAEEKLLDDKPEHLIARHEIDKMPVDNEWGFKVDTPEYKYNRGELYNLSVIKGTLSEEERYMINGHMIQTIIMLNKLPYPKHLRNVPLIAGSHHETLDGKGYPKKLVMTEQPMTARMMVIADIFEALTAADRPYKKAKTLTESLRILSFMRNDRHIDADLFDLFLSSGVYLDYAKQFLLSEQIDEVDINDYLSK